MSVEGAADRVWVIGQVARYRLSGSAAAGETKAASATLIPCAGHGGLPRRLQEQTC